jgi:chromate transporter
MNEQDTPTATDDMPAPAAARPAARTERVSLGQIFRVFFTLGISSFGGGVVAYLRQELVVRERWLEDETFVTGLELCQTLPGLNATNMSVYVGERLRGAPGALVACAGMMLPGTVIVMVLAVLFASRTGLDLSAVLTGVGSAAVGLLLATTWKLSRPVVENATDVVIALSTLIAVSYFHLSLIVVLFTIGPIAVWIYHPRRKTRAPRAPLEHDR